VALRAPASRSASSVAVSVVEAAVIVAASWSYFTRYAP
jgi:hypothetical protein